MPGEKVQQRSQRLSNDAKRHPKDHVSGDLSADALDFLENVGEDDQRDLEHHAGEGYAYGVGVNLRLDMWERGDLTKDVVRGDSDEELVQEAREEENDDLCD